MEEAVGWLQGLRGRYERHHGVRFTEDALEAGARWRLLARWRQGGMRSRAPAQVGCVQAEAGPSGAPLCPAVLLVPAAVTAAQRYIPERRLPDSAIDVMDEAAARTRLRAAAAARAAAQTAALRGAAAEAAGALGSSLQGGPPLDAMLSASEQMRRTNEWLLATQQALGPSASQAPPAAVAAQPSGLGAAAANALSCPHCGTPAVPHEGSGGLCCLPQASTPQRALLLPILPAHEFFCAQARAPASPCADRALVLASPLMLPQ